MSCKDWYREMSVYQIWVRSFCDGNGDGIGDFMGILSKLDYINSLNVDAVCFSPVFPSPKADYGYDISDFTDIDPDYGSIDSFRELLEQAHGHGLRVFMELVTDRTSDEHYWFRESGRDAPYHDYYYRRPAKYIGKRRLPPGSLTAQFDGGTWEYDSRSDEYYLCSSFTKQPLLDFGNPKVRDEFKRIMRFWLDMGVDGFCVNAAHSLSKVSGLSDRYPKLPFGKGTPVLSEYLKEFRKDVLDYYDCFVIGKLPSITPNTALNYISDGSEKVFDEMFAFDHMGADGFPGDLLSAPFSLKKMKKAFTEWQTKLDGKAWNALYIEGCDHPRIISRFGNESYRRESGKMLAAMYILQRGTPFVYQGQEIGMLNIALPRLEMYRDALTFSTAALLSKLMSYDRMIKVINRRSRDNARTPMQWNGRQNAGFTDGKPWFTVNPNYYEINADNEEKDPDSILNFYRKLLKFKKENHVAIYGTYKELMSDSKTLYVYERELHGEKLLVICSFTNEQLRFEADGICNIEDAEPVLSNYEHNFVISNGFTTRPYEMRVYHFK